MTRSTDIHDLPLYVGTSGWAYLVGNRDSIRRICSPKNYLKHYATKLTAVEVNYTFRRLLSEQAAQSWMKDVAPSFKFVAKANYYITHVRRLKDVTNHWSDFCRRWSR